MKKTNSPFLNFLKHLGNNMGEKWIKKSKLIISISENLKRKEKLVNEGREADDSIIWSGD